MSDLKANMHKIRFPLGLCPIPRWGSLQRSPRPLAVFGGLLLRGWRAEKRGEEEREGKGRGREEEGKEREGEGPAPKCFGLEQPMDPVQPPKLCSVRGIWLYESSAKTACTASDACELVFATQCKLRRSLVAFIVS